MKQKIRWIAETAVMLALLVTLQAVTKSMGQLVTGSFVNGVLAMTVLVAGLSSGLVVALVSPVVACMLSIAPTLTMPAIMAGNAVFIAVLHFVWSKHPVRRILAWLAAAISKFAVLYAVVVWLICGVLAQTLLETGVMKPPMVTALPATFSWPQLITALIGGGVAMVVAPVVKKALKR